MINNERELSVLLLVGIMLPLFILGGCLQSKDIASKEDSIEKSETQTIKNITPQEAFDLIQKNKNNPNFVILDVRTPGEFSSERIEGAIMLDYYSRTFRNDLDNPDKNKIYLIYCRTGARSGSALDIMKGLNFTEVYNISGGINRWKAKGLPRISRQGIDANNR